MQSKANRNGLLKLRGKRAILLHLMVLFVLFLPGNARAAAMTVSTEEELLAALEAGETAISFAAELSTETSMLIPEGTVIDLDGFSWTVEKGTVAVHPTAVVGGAFTASKNGTIRELRTIALEHAVAGERIKRVTYTDGETDDAAIYIADSAVGTNGTVSLYLKKGKSVSRAATVQSVYRLGTADASRLSLVYEISYRLDGGKIAGGSNPTEYTAADAPITLLNPVRDGYTFLGWTGSGLTEPTEHVTIPMQSTGNRSYTAIWEETEQGGTESGGSSDRPSGGSSGSSGRSVLAENETAETDAETDETVSDKAEDPAVKEDAQTQQSSRRISTASASVKTKFHGARPATEPVDTAAASPQRDWARLCIGAGLLLLALAGWILLRRQKND